MNDKLIKDNSFLDTTFYPPYFPKVLVTV